MSIPWFVAGSIGWNVEIETMKKYYTDEKNVQFLVALLKAHNVRKVIASPGSANSPLVASLQHDQWFEMYSSVDERSAAYMACGLAEQSGEPVVLSCTGATASRNYLPGLTEAYYRKLPVLAITSTQPISRVGHHFAQVIDRSTMPNDVVKISVTLPIIKDDEDQWDCEIKVNRAILELVRHGGGPAHINLQTNSRRTYTTKTLPKPRMIERITRSDAFPELPRGKVAVFVGAHSEWSVEDTEAVDRFCAANDAVVFCDHTSGYKGSFRVLYSVAACQQTYEKEANRPDILIHIGEVTGDYASLGISGHQVWRVSLDGETRDTFRKLRYVFEMSENTFFEHYSRREEHSDAWRAECHREIDAIRVKMPDLPFSNIWLASKMARRIPEGATIHFGILNSLRSWNLFELPNSVTSASNVGGFGIDGGLSSLVGASLSDKDKLFFGVIGDLAFFYDLNVLGNRHVGKNLRILLVNNGKGTEFRQYKHHTSHFGDRADRFIAAAGHFGNQSRELVKHYVQSLGFEYLAASNKEEFDEASERFLTPELTDRPILFEAFTDSTDESKALEMVMNIQETVRGKARQVAKHVLGGKPIKLIRRVVK